MGKGFSLILILTTLLTGGGMSARVCGQDPPPPVTPPPKQTEKEKSESENSGDEQDVDKTQDQEEKEQSPPKQEEKKAEFEELISQTKGAFANLSLEALEKNTQQFLSLANETLSRQTELGKQDLEGKKELIGQTVDAVGKELDKLREMVSNVAASICRRCWKGMA